MPQNVDPSVGTIPSTGLEAYLTGQIFAIAVNGDFVTADHRVSLPEFRDLSSLPGPVMVNLEKCSSVERQLAVSHYGKLKLTAPYASSAVFRITKPQLSCKSRFVQDMQLLSHQQGTTDSCVSFVDPPAVSAWIATCLGRWLELQHVSCLTAAALSMQHQRPSVRGMALPVSPAPLICQL